MRREVTPARAVLALTAALLAAACSDDDAALPPGFEPLGDEVAVDGWPRRVVHEASGIVLVRIEPGTFLMGTRPTETGRDGDEDLHEAEVEEPFYLGETEVTVGQWKTVVGELPMPPEEDEEGTATGLVSDLPAESITWYRAKEFLVRLDEIGPAGWRLPTEVEWEYACRAGTRTAFSCGDDATILQVNYDARYPLHGQVVKDPALYRGGVVPVRSLPPNAWGLYEMHGNVFEWCEDVYVQDPEHQDPPEDPTASRVIRGGAWNSMAKRSRSGHRDGYPPDSDGSKYGFRAVWSPPR